jgi:hypothetical protein
MRPPRLTIRRLMVAVAVVAALIGFSLMGWRSMEYRRLAIQHEHICSTLEGEIASLKDQAQEASAKGLPASEHLINATERKKALAEEQRSVAVFRYKMWHPWEQVRFR